MAAAALCLGAYTMLLCATASAQDRERSRRRDDLKNPDPGLRQEKSAAPVRPLIRGKRGAESPKSNQNAARLWVPEGNGRWGVVREERNDPSRGPAPPAQRTGLPKNRPAAQFTGKIEEQETAKPPANAAADETAEYWIVSSRQCVDRGTTILNCPLDYFERHPGEVLHATSSAEMVSKLVPGVPVCIVVHGSYVDWDGHIHQMSSLSRWLRRAGQGQPLQIIFFTWPSDGPLMYLPLIDLAGLGRRATRNGFRLAELVQEIPAGNPVCLLGHSHGARVVVSGLHLLGGGSIERVTLPQGGAAGRRLRAVLLAAAVDRHWMDPGEAYDRALWPVEGLLNLRDVVDLPLSLYWLRKPGSRQALAITGFTWLDRWRLGPLAAKVRDVDVTGAVGLGHMWQNYYVREDIGGLLRPYVYFDVAVTRPPGVQTGAKLSTGGVQGK